MNLDIANLFNSSGITGLSGTYASWLRPTAIHQARLFKISANFDF